MDKESLHNNHGNSISNSISSVRDRDKSDGSGSLLLRASSDSIRQTTTTDLVLQWGNRKRPRCMKVQVKDHSSNLVQRTTVRVDRRVVRTDKDSSNHHTPTPSVINNINNNHNQSNGYPNLRQRLPSPQQPPQRILREKKSNSD